ncbi:MAG: hypothetical protein JWR69_4535 [Pedosphaera sp.]|nr:hypothetical protein [Pedosphaera sp.]
MFMESSRSNGDSGLQLGRAGEYPAGEKLKRVFINYERCECAFLCPVPSQNAAANLGSTGSPAEASNCPRWF